MYVYLIINYEITELALEHFDTFEFIRYFVYLYPRPDSFRRQIIAT